MSYEPPRYDPRLHQQRVYGGQDPYAGQQPAGGWPSPPPSPHQRPPRGKSWPRRHPVLSVLGGLGTLIVISVAVSAGNGGSTPSASAGTGAVKATTAAAPAQQTITYIVTGSGADVTYGPAGSSLSGSAPMRVTRPLGNPAYYDISAQLQGGGSVSCKIEVDGKVISSATATGGYNIADCEISQDPLSGQWTDANQG